MKNFAKLVLVVFGLVGFAKAAFAHSKVNTTTPENETVLQQAPSSIDMTFGNKIRLTKVTLQIKTRLISIWMATRVLKTAVPQCVRKQCSV